MSDLAAQAKRDPWTLEDDSGNPLITIPAPTVGQMEGMAAAESMYDVMRILAGDQYDDLMAHLRPLGSTAIAKAADDMRERFGMGNSPA